MWYHNDFLHGLRRLGLSEYTIRNYRTHLERFTTYCTAQGKDDIRQVTDEDTDRFMKAVLGELPHSPTWKYAGVLCIRKYLQWLTDRSILFAPPAIRMKKPRHTSQPHQSVDLPELHSVLDSIPTDTDSDVLLKVILELGYSSALRSAELRRLTIEHIDFSTGVLFIEQSKGKKDRVVPVGETALKWVQEYVQNVRPRYCTDPDERRVFIGIRTKAPFKPRAFSQFVYDRLIRNNLPAISPHRLRASAATHLVTGGMSVAYVQQLLGHRELRTTQTYVQIQSNELRRMLEKSHPRNTMKNRRNKK